MSVAEFRLTAVPNGRVEGAFVVLNDEARSVDVSLRVADWDEDESGAVEILPVGRVVRSCSGWLSGTAGGFRLAPLEERSVAFVARVPETGFGTYWAAFVIRAASADAVATESVVRVFIDVPPIDRNVAVAEVIVLDLDPLTLSARVANLGTSCVYAAQGLIAVESEWGPVASAAVPAFRLLPGHARNVLCRASWGLESSGTYLVRIVLDYGAEALVAGQVTVRIP